MREEEPIPVFGRREAGRQYVIRPSAYCIVENGQGEIAAAMTPSGLILLGGGIETGETPEETVTREAREECGLIVRPAGEIARATQFIYSQSERTYYEKPSVFLRASLEGEAAAVEEDHELLWLRPAAAAPRMYHESHGWVLGKYQESLVAADPNEFLPKERVP